MGSGFGFRVKIGARVRVRVRVRARVRVIIKARVNIRITTRLSQGSNLGCVRLALTSFQGFIRVSPKCLA